MCPLFDEIEKEGKITDEAKGIIETGFDFGLSENDILQRLQNKLNVSLQKHRNILKCLENRQFNSYSYFTAPHPRGFYYIILQISYFILQSSICLPYYHFILFIYDVR